MFYDKINVNVNPIHLSLSLSIISPSLCYLGQLCFDFGANLASKPKILSRKCTLILLVLFGTNLVNNIKRSTIFKAPLALFNANKLQI